MVRQKRIISLAVSLAVVLLVFALCVPVLHERLRGTTLSPKEKLSSAPVVEGEGDAEGEGGVARAGDAAFLPSAAAPSLPSELEPDLSTISWPLEGQVLRGLGLSYAQTFSDYRYHDGIDIQAARGAEVVAVLSGKVIGKESTKEEKTVLSIDHGQGWVSIYAHLEDAYLAVGDYCQAGERLGIIYQPGLNEVLEGPHLHFSLRHDQQSVNPLDYLPLRP